VIDNSKGPYYTPDYNIEIDKPLTLKDSDGERGKERARI
jgi:hypothetical protein